MTDIEREFDIAMMALCNKAIDLGYEPGRFRGMLIEAKMNRRTAVQVAKGPFPLVRFRAASSDSGR
jgi:hypothetical protein